MRIKGGHGREHEDIIHYHLLYKFRGRVNELRELFRDTVGSDTKAATIGDLKFLIDNTCFYDANYPEKVSPEFYLTWNGCLLDDNSKLIRDIKCKSAVFKPGGPHGDIIEIHTEPIDLDLEKLDETYIGLHNDAPDKETYRNISRGRKMRKVTKIPMDKRRKVRKTRKNKRKGKGK